ncbi:MAG: SPASM domain-containing protein, partial [Candidatus Bathyarchaeia archaeon]
EVTVGNVRERSLEEIWNDPDNEVLNMFRDKDKLKGKCGRCEYKAICGGCRIRAYQRFGDYLQEDPVCFYTPTGVLEAKSEGEAY